ncbi:hypothetical protein SUGI_1085820 [Cryptomeria japonica]|uniref:long-chain-alcohol oxidase FAO1 n=1 Tax=Cryptomeria japonica TaxID=3369 RepID=UPI00241478BF|nr:long-chain-alcohol oxidase FAO1 [Cryptomeria japonica]GLJ50983.1 hypothetical protein SUGI_1085820 [Cryptomeria japonica]
MEGHEMLRGGQKACYNHGFSAAEMKSLAALCDSFIPSVFAEEKDVDSFDLLSGSYNGVPDQVADVMRCRVKPVGVCFAKWVLWLLSTRFGTWLLCGSASFSPRFPYLQTFSQVSGSRRERILVDWSQGKRFTLLKFAFKLFKICCCFTFYTLVDDNGKNPSWQFIGYTPPNFQPSEKSQGKKPLDNGVIDLSSDQDLAAQFKGRGFTVSSEADSSGRSNWVLECDAVVVGSGSGGGVAAGTLAQAGYRVIVVEKGNYYARQDLSLLEGPSLQHMYDSGGILSTNDLKILIMAGSTVGGGSAINWSACIPTPPEKLTEWSQNYHLPLFATETYQTAMKTVCERLGVNDRCPKHSFQNTILREGCSKLGFTVHSVPRNSTQDHFCGSCCYGCPTGNKKGTDETWLVDAVNAGAIILTGCKADKVLTLPNKIGQKKNRATGVSVYTRTGTQIIIQASVTVASCGALQTPPLLRRSGLQNPNTGKNLRLHPVQMAWGYFPDGSGPAGKSYEGGIITTMCKHSGTINQTPAVGAGSFAALIPWTSGADMKSRMRKYSRTAHIFSLVGDQGSGTVMAEREIEYRICDGDRQKLTEGLARAVRILIAAGATEVGTHRSDGLRFSTCGASHEEIEEFIGKVASCNTMGKHREGNKIGQPWTPVCSAHQMGSCRMGQDPEAGAVDWKGESWEVEGLFVCDGSLLPTSLGVNPMITIQSIALCVSRHIVQSLDRNSVPPNKD